MLSNEEKYKIKILILAVNSGVVTLEFLKRPEDDVNNLIFNIRGTEYQLKIFDDAGDPDYIDSIIKDDQVLLDYDELSSLSMDIDGEDYDFTNINMSREVWESRS